MARISIDIPDADVPALAVQLGDRFVGRDGGATDVAHVTTAMQAWAAQEVTAGRRRAAQATLQAVEANPGSTTAQREAAALAEYRTRA